MRKNESLDRNIRQNLAYAIKHNGPLRWSSILGFSKEEFIKHIKDNLIDNMTMENYGTEWVISFHIPRKCYKFNSIKDDNFRRFWSLKNIMPKRLKEAQGAKKIISKQILNKYSLWDILPDGNIASLLCD